MRAILRERSSSLSASDLFSTSDTPTFLLNCAQSHTRLPLLLLFPAPLEIKHALHHLLRLQRPLRAGLLQLPPHSLHLLIRRVDPLQHRLLPHLLKLLQLRHIFAEQRFPLAHLLDLEDSVLLALLLESILNHLDELSLLDELVPLLVLVELL